MRPSRRIFATAAVATAILGLAYAVFGHDLIAALHDGRLGGWFDQIFPDQGECSLQTLFRIGDCLFLAGIGGIWLAAWIGARWGKLHRVTRWLVIAAGIHLVVIQPLLAATSSAGTFNTVLRRTKEFLTFEEHTDSWWPMYEAYNHTRQPNRAPLYDAVFFERKTKFQYAPTALLIVPPLKALSGPIESRDHFTGPVLIISWGFVVLLMVCSGFILHRGLRGRAECAEIAFSEVCLQAFLVALLTITFYPAVRAYELGQIQTWINGLIALALLSRLHGRLSLAGALTGLVCLMKPTYAVILLWGLSRRSWTFLRGAVIVLAAGMLASLAVFGLTDHLDYLHVLSYLSKRGEVFFPNQSMNGLLNRLFQHDVSMNLDWSPHSFPDFHWQVYAGTLITSVALVGCLLIIPARKRFPEQMKAAPGTLEFALAILTATMASPIAWEHHYGVLLPIFALLVPVMAVRRDRFPEGGTWLLVAFLLSASIIQPVRRLAGNGAWNILQSYLYFGGLITLGLLYRSLELRSDAPGPAQPQAASSKPSKSSPPNT